MAAKPRSKRRSSPLADTLLVLFSLLLSVFGAELVVRALNGQPLFAFPLPDPVGSASVEPGQLEQIKRAGGVGRAGGGRGPPPRPGRGGPPAGGRGGGGEGRGRPGGDGGRPGEAGK